MSGRLAVVLFNLGGPDRPESVRPFLYNLFRDPAIIGVPNPLRTALAWLIATRRAPVARDIYARIGGKSPLLDMTLDQASALEGRLRDRHGSVRVFVCMRYWHPMSAEATAAVKAYDPETVVLLPLYPQFSTTTSASSLNDWHRAAARTGLSAATRTVCCYPEEAGLVAAHAELTRVALEEAARHGLPRVLFSAHGLPERIVAGGDPYQWQVERTVAAVVRAANGAIADHAICYQSRVGPLKWIGPSTEEELHRAAKDGVPVVVVPIAFVSEHSETLVELDMDYAEQARRWGVPAFVRVPAVGLADAFVDGLANLVDATLAGDRDPFPGGGQRLCPPAFAKCPCAVP